MSPRPAPGSGPRLVDAMPKPVLVLFVIGALVAIGVSIYFVAKPPSFGTVPLAERRPPPSGSVTHDAGEVFPAPTPTVAIPYDAPCPEVASVRPQGGASFTRRMEDALALACSVAAGPSDILVRAVAGLDGATVRIAQFERSGVESHADADTRTIFLNLKFTERRRSAAELVPVLLHEAWHLANTGPVTAASELGARAVEVAACRQFVPIARWPRWCQDARALTDMARVSAIDALVAAGYARD